MVTTIYLYSGIDLAYAWWGTWQLHFLNKRIFEQSCSSKNNIKSINADRPNLAFIVGP